LPKRPTHAPRLLNGRVFTQLTISVEPTSSNCPSAEARRPPTKNGDFISLGEAFKLVPYFEGNKQEVLAFSGNVDTAFAVINPVQEDVFYRFVLKRIS